MSLLHTPVRFAACTAAASTMLMLAAALPVAAYQDTGPTSQPDRQTQQAKDAKQKKTTTTTDAGDGLLAGPKVKVDDELGGPASMTRPGQQRLQQMPLVQWVRQLRQLGLSAEQWQTIQPEIDAFLEVQREYQQTHGQELRALRQEIRQARQDNKPVPELLKKATALQGLAPKPEDLQEYIWAQLTPAQQDTLREQIDRWREQRQAAAADRVDRADRRQDQATDDATGSMTDMMIDTAEGSAMSDEDQAQARQQQQQRRRRAAAAGQSDAATAGDADDGRSALDRNARMRLRFLRALQKRQQSGNNNNDG